MKKMMMQVLSVLLCVALLVPPMAPRAKAAITRETIASFFDDVSFYYGLAKDVLELGGVVLDINYDELSSPTDIKGTVWETGTGWMGDVSRYVEVDDVALSVFARDLHDEFGYTGLSFYLTTISGYGKSYRVVACDGMNEATLKPITYIFTLDGIVLCAPVGDEPLPDIWIPKEDAGDRIVLLSYEDFYNKVMENAGAGCDFEDHTKNLFYQTSSGAKYMVAYSYPDREYFLARSDGAIYACRVNPENSATSQDRPATGTTDNSDQDITIEEGANVGIDIDNATVTLPDGSVLEMISNTYDESSKTYYVDARQYIEEGDTYIYNTYRYTYHINYTSITYIGQTEEYNKYYEVYYELPDGRSSADLTAEDLEQLNVSVDVIPYGRSADDTSLRSLYHFDGDTKDSSYWNYCTDFTWNKGASLTYMDAGVFDGALYLDETEHDFTITLPSAIGSGDFTLQFRYYQSHTEAPVTDAYVGLSVGGNVYKPLQFDGSSVKNSAGEVVSSMPIGSWNELAVVRSNGIGYIYLNGLCVFVHSPSSSISIAPFTDDVVFHFGSDQQTFKYLDELRVLNYALVDDGASYECTSVPHDTNLTLVLPDSQLPVADEYWKWDTTIPPVYAFDFVEGGSLVNTSTYNSSLGLSVADCWGKLYAPLNGTFSVLDQGTFYTVSNSSISNGIFFVDSLCYFPVSSGLNLPICIGQLYYDYPSYPLAQSSKYTVSVVDRSGKVFSYTFTFNPYASRSRNGVVWDISSKDFGDFIIRLAGYNEGPDDEGNQSGNGISIQVIPDAGKSIDIVYMELVKGSTPNTGHEFVSSVTGIDRKDLNTPTLAVRTDVNITRYQIGGPRPSVPQKGLVWALVENDRITSIQIYNGSAWEGVDGRIWTGERWIPASSFNIITLQDMYDIVDATHDFEYIYTESGFWAWWQRSWNDFTKMIDDRLKAIINALGGSAGAGEIEKPDEEGKSKFSLGQLLGKVTSAIASVPAAALTGLVGVVSDLVGAFVESISEFSTGLSDLLDVFHSFGLVAAEGEDGDGGVLPQAAGIAQLTKGAFAALPSDLQTMFTISFFMLIIVGIIRLLI